MTLPRSVKLGIEVARALEAGHPVVALETAVASHGLPEPENLQAIEAMECAVRDAGAIPATCLIETGWLCVGAVPAQVHAVTRDPGRHKASVRDIGPLVAEGASAGLTVSATLFAAALVGIRVFATGGIGGVHDDATTSGDVSADLVQLSRSPVITVCSGAKSVLDIPRTLEYLETLGVPVFAYDVPHFPGFYLLSSGIAAPLLASPEAVARVARAQWELGHQAALVVGNPIPVEEALPQKQWQSWMDGARDSARTAGVRGKDVTPYLLSRVAEYSNGRTVRANLALLASNARLAGEIAVAFAS